MDRKRIYYPTKAAWASAKADELRRQAKLLPTVHSYDWRGVQARTRALRSYRDDAAKYERMALRYRAQGV